MGGGGDQAVAFDLSENYKMKEVVGSGGFGQVCSAFDMLKVLQHRYVGDGKKKVFSVSFKHLRPEEAQRLIWVYLEQDRIPFKVLSDSAWPLHVQMDSPPKGNITIGTYEQVAIKKVTDVFSDLQHSKYTLRELKLLHFFSHENLIGLRDVFLPPNRKDGKWNDLYVVTELLDNNLRQIVKSKQPITTIHASYFLWQVLCGVKAMHDSDIIHRDLKPHNILINQNCDIKICDFGMARMEQVGEDMTEEVQTIWYRSPEVLVESKAYSKPIDMWACGCILGELLVRQALFMGKHTRNMLELIIQMLGTPKAEDLDLEEGGNLNNVREFLLSLESPQIDWESWKRKRCPEADPLGLDLISNLLVFNPHKRFTVEEALNHPFCHLWKEETEPGDEQEILRQMCMIRPQVPHDIRKTTEASCDAIIAAVKKGEDFSASLKQLVSQFPDIKIPLQHRFGISSDKPTVVTDAKAVAYYFKCLKDRPVSGESLIFDDAFEAKFKDIAPHKEGSALKLVKETIEAEIKSLHEVQAQGGGITGRLKHMGLESTGTDFGQVQCIELTALTDTPTPVE